MENTTNGNIMTTQEAMGIAQATVESVLRSIEDEIRTIAHIYDSKDLFGIAYSKFSEKIIEVIDEYIEK